MALSRRLYLVLAIACLTVVVLLHTRISEHLGFSSTTTAPPVWSDDEGRTLNNTAWPDSLISSGYVLRISEGGLSVGAPTASSPNHSRVLVVASTSDEDTTWIETELPNLETAIYVADDPQAPLRPPKNKGHEVMIYLSYIIDQYDKLPEVVLFMHAHRWSYHNNELQGADAVQMIKALSNERVTREGYVNVRCHWDPGCPGHLHPLSKVMDFHQLQGVMAEKWVELFPLDPIPDTLSQPCCAQFAVSRARIQSIPISRFIAYRDWLLRTHLTDYYSGRLWEYLWHFIFTGQTVLCPKEHVCYCDGYGICFGGEEQYNDWFSIQDQKKRFDSELGEWQKKDQEVKDAVEKGDAVDGMWPDAPETGRDVFLRDQIDALNKELDTRKDAAIERGRDPKNRALEAGREWKEGDGF
ncbi:MAG: hypothetical protein M1817_005885 [Caeruleum heppii]|nr:MAG: hypothetical protein M1817_005885 [Caeruleum heppii]